MAFNHFSWHLSVRVVIMVTVVLSLVWAIATPGYHILSIALAGLCMVLIWETLTFVKKTNEELSRFLDAARYGDFTQRFEFPSLGTGFEQLGSTFNAILARFQHQREEQETALRHLRAMVEHVPVPLISVHTNGQLTQWNKSARRLLGSGEITHIDNLAVFGPHVPTQINQLQPGQRQLMTFDVDGMDHQLAVSATDLLYDRQREKLVSLLDIRSELDTAQLNAWQDLVRVLTHEIMNSMTPIASLAQTASQLATDIQQRSDLPEALHHDMQDLQDAVDTLARRSDSLMHFVGSYRRLTRLPDPQLAPVGVKSLLDDVATVVAHDWQNQHITLSIDVQPASLQISADRAMLEQVLINLLHNAQHALQGSDNGEVKIEARLNRRSHAVLSLTDNGTGIKPDLLDKIFVPFFTTKREGSGVGLALSRQIMIAHGGTIGVVNVPQGGARFTLTF
ncbi:PAS domain-containing protein [Aestuariibacter halophilus]|uniref:histidine kinase n=1 Tax=Fluctibacter halophilus TaxID=226011 RepID=A0ABS8G8W7_9ALTE|nr:ATP-binding protein [Aestuariibacter halophilus]MCC2617027.1 PAS domain-containing protein [Aestuariibacter halophilus]